MLLRSFANLLFTEDSWPGTQTHTADMNNLTFHEIQIFIAPENSQNLAASKEDIIAGYLSIFQWFQELIEKWWKQIQTIAKFGRNKTRSRAKTRITFIPAAATLIPKDQPPVARPRSYHQRGHHHLVMWKHYETRFRLYQQWLLQVITQFERFFTLLHPTVVSDRLFCYGFNLSLSLAA